MSAEKACHPVDSEVGLNRCAKEVVGAASAETAAAHLAVANSKTHVGLNSGCDFTFFNLI